MSEIHFSLGDKLPTVYDAVITIYSISTQPTSSKMGSVIRQYGLTLIAIWERHLERNMLRLSVELNLN